MVLSEALRAGQWEGSRGDWFSAGRDHACGPLGPCSPSALLSSALPLASQIPCCLGQVQAGRHPWPLQAGCPLTRAFDGRRWHRQGLWHWNIHSVLAESGAGVLAGFPGRKELSVCGQAASKVVMQGGERGKERGRRGRGLDKSLPLASRDCSHCTLGWPQMPRVAAEGDQTLTSRSPTTGFYLGAR